MQPEQTILKCSTDATVHFLNFLLPYCTTNCANVAKRCNLLIAVGSTNSSIPNRWTKQVRGTPILYLEFQVGDVCANFLIAMKNVFTLEYFLGYCVLTYKKYINCSNIRGIWEVPPKENLFKWNKIPSIVLQVFFFSQGTDKTSTTGGWTLSYSLHVPGRMWISPNWSSLCEEVCGAPPLM